MKKLYTKKLYTKKLYTKKLYKINKKLLLRGKVIEDLDIHCISLNKFDMKKACHYRFKGKSLKILYFYKRAPHDMENMGVTPQEIVNTFLKVFTGNHPGQRYITI